MFSLARIADFTWFCYFSNRFVGSDVARSQKGSIESEVLHDLRTSLIGLTCLLQIAFESN